MLVLNTHHILKKKKQSLYFHILVIKQYYNLQSGFLVFGNKMLNLRFRKITFISKNVFT